VSVRCCLEAIRFVALMHTKGRWPYYSEKGVGLLFCIVADTRVRRASSGLPKGDIPQPLADAWMTRNGQGAWGEWQEGIGAGRRPSHHESTSFAG
jgi:hypothetical protein